MVSCFFKAEMSALEREAQEWIEAVTGESLSGGFAESLKNGVILCKWVVHAMVPLLVRFSKTMVYTFWRSLYPNLLRRLINRLKPGSVHKINEPATMPFKKMENIANYLKGVRALGMKEFEMFGTPDLYDEKNIAQVRMHLLLIAIKFR